MKKFALFLLMLAFGLSEARAQETYLFAQRDTCNLYMDVYRPQADSLCYFQGKEKPTIVYVFGGGFITGHRDDAYVVEWFQRLTANGYKVVSIDYRLGMKDYQVGKGISGKVKAADRFKLSQQVGVEDLFSAISFIADNAEELGIDPGNLVVAGCSAGAIIAQAAEYDIVCGRTQGLPEGFNFKGVMAFAGAVIGTSGAPDYPVQPCPILMLHGTVDQAVAYKKLAVMGKGLWGSDFLAAQFQKKGYKGWCIYRFLNRTHDVAAYMNYLWDIEQPFLEQNVMMGNPRTVDAVVDDPTLPTWHKIDLESIYNR